MQQRYCDPMIGRCLSVDPVTAYDSGDMRLFNRYAYAYNNPYKFTDPDGRNPLGISIGMSTEIAWQMKVEGKSWSEVDRSDVFVAGLIGAIAPGAGSTLLRAGRMAPKVVRSAKAIKVLTEQAAKTANRAAKIESRVNSHVQRISSTVGDAVATTTEAAGGVVAKNLLQDAVNEQQQSSSRSQEEIPKPPSPPPPPPHNQDERAIQ